MRLPACFSTAVAFLLWTTLTSAAASKDYDESLLLRTLPGNSVLASFRFITNGTFTDHHSLFPRSLAQILQHSRTRELHLKFTLGRWDFARWGAQIWDGNSAGGTGVELWAWVEADADPNTAEASADARWTTLTNALSGLFCASLNFIDKTRTIRPVMSFQPTGDHKTLDGLHLLHGSLPKEPVCTENLTPFLKLLPCKGKAGISSLLDGHKLFDAQWQSMSIDVRPVCDADGQCRLQLEQTVDMVLDIQRSLQRQSTPVPKPQPVESLSCDPEKPYGNEGDSCFPRANVADLGFSLHDLFGRRALGQCPLSTIAAPSVCVEIPAERPIFISGDATEVKELTAAGERRCFVLPAAGHVFDLQLPAHSPPLDNSAFTPPPPLYASRSFTGHGQEFGGVQAVLTNPSLTDSVDVIYLESLPWFMKPYVHTLKAVYSPPLPSAPPAITSLYYLPPLDRARGTHLEAALTLPPNSTLIITYEFSKSPLRYTEYPPDANRGFDIPPAVITLPKLGASGVSIRTTSLLLSLPTPDFSMPYNVIILTSTVIALAFGSVFNIIVRRFVGAGERGEGVLKRMKGRLGMVLGEEGGGVILGLEFGCFRDEVYRACMDTLQHDMR